MKLERLASRLRNIKLACDQLDVRIAGNPNHPRRAEWIAKRERLGRTLAKAKNAADVLRDIGGTVAEPPPGELGLSGGGA